MQAKRNLVLAQRLVADLIGQRLCLGAVLRLALDGRLAQTRALGLHASVRDHRELSRQEEVATVAVSDLLDVAGLADTLYILGQHHPHCPSPPLPLNMDPRNRPCAEGAT